MTQVYMIVGLGRSGTTIIGKKLAEHMGGVFVGELIYLASRGLDSKSLCGCGVFITECDVWRPIISQLTDSEKTALKTAEADLRLKNIFLFSNHARYRDLFARVHNLFGDRPLVDSSKIFPYALLFRRNPKYVFIHVVRDPLQVTSSMLSKKYIPEQGAEGYLHRGGVFKSPLRWSLVNLLVKYFLPVSHTVFYEDFVENHEAIFAKIAEAKPGSVSGHSLAGNPSRFGDQTIKPQLQRRAFSPLENLCIKVLSWPFRLLTKRY